MATLTPALQSHSRTAQPTSAVKVFPASKTTTAAYPNAASGPKPVSSLPVAASPRPLSAAGMASGVRPAVAPGAATVKSAAVAAQQTVPTAARSPVPNNRVVVSSAAPKAAVTGATAYQPQQKLPVGSVTLAQQASSTLSRSPATLQSATVTAVAAKAPSPTPPSSVETPQATETTRSAPTSPESVNAWGRMAQNAVAQPIPLEVTVVPVPAADKADEKDNFVLKPSVGTWLQAPVSERTAEATRNGTTTEAETEKAPLTQKATNSSSCWCGVMKVLRREK
mmetsp:Transcript_58374/g.139180  ORF Transcript_58374/g.139180 Transcript_58374/m.139180 type:complete len:281 (+) Transcript_58374:96-938(+)